MLPAPKRRQHSNTLRLMPAEFCMMTASFSPVKTYPAPPMSAASW